MASKARINEMAEDIKKDYGAVVTVTDVKNYLKCSRAKAVSIVKNLIPMGANTGRCYFYKEVAAAILDWTRCDTDRRYTA